jgi:co-chaperonin GroES (HSP10)
MPFESERELLEAKEKQDREFDATYTIQDGNRVIVGEQIALSIVVGDNIIVLEDRYKDPNVCDVCNDTKRVIDRCGVCGGSGVNRFNTNCSACAGKGSMTIVCEACRGKIILPDRAKARPTSGVVMSVGPDVKVYKIGDRVAYSGYTGHLIPFKGGKIGQNTRLRIMTEREPFCLVEQVGQAADDVKIEFISKDTAYDVE